MLELLRLGEWAEEAAGTVIQDGSGIHTCLFLLVSGAVSVGVVSDADRAPEANADAGHATAATTAGKEVR